MDKTTSDLSLAAARTILRRASLRCTAARIAVVQRLADAGVPVSHSELTDELGHFGFDQSTIYRCLNELAEAGILSRLDLGDQVRRFEFRISNPSQGLEHPHFMCVDCGKIFCLSDFRWQLTPGKKSTTRVGSVTEVLVKGHCSDCQA